MLSHVVWLWSGCTTGHCCGKQLFQCVKPPPLKLCYIIIVAHYLGTKWSGFLLFRVSLVKIAHPLTVELATIVMSRCLGPKSEMQSQMQLPINFWHTHWSESLSRDRVRTRMLGSASMTVHLPSNSENYDCCTWTPNVRLLKFNPIQPGYINFASK